MYVLYAKKSEPLKPSIYKEAAETIIEEIVHPEIPKPSPILKNKWLHVSDEFGVMHPGISELYYPAKKLCPGNNTHTSRTRSVLL